jgi:hypothetical protein
VRENPAFARVTIFDFLWSILQNSKSLSNKRLISELKIKFFPIKEACGIGDLVEILSVHELRLPPLGICFSLAEINNEATNISCSIQILAQDSPCVKVENSDISTKISFNEKSKIYLFEWNQYFHRLKRIFLKKMSSNVNY